MNEDFKNVVNFRNEMFSRILDHFNYEIFLYISDEKMKNIYKEMSEGDDHSSVILFMNFEHYLGYKFSIDHSLKGSVLKPVLQRKEN